MVTARIGLVVVQKQQVNQGAIGYRRPLQRFPGQHPGAPHCGSLQ
jgi:hypothetical protein